MEAFSNAVFKLLKDVSCEDPHENGFVFLVSVE
jgi:hypothetical protein